MKTRLAEEIVQCLPLLICSDGDMAVQVTSDQPPAATVIPALDSATHNNSNSMTTATTSTVPAYQYDASGMTELSLVTDEVRTYQSVMPSHSSVTYGCSAPLRF